MNDRDLLDRVRDSAADLTCTTSVAEILARGRQLRRRRRQTVGVLAAAAALAVVAAPLVLPGHGPTTLLSAAWAVESTSPDTVTVTVRQLADPQGLQQALARAGIRAHVSYEPPTCPYLPATLPLGKGKAFTQNGDPTVGEVTVVDIHPSALPADDTLMITVVRPGLKSDGLPAILIQVIQGQSPVCFTPGPKITSSQ